MQNEERISVWAKSSFSTDHDTCVEIAFLENGVAVRDSKDPAGPALAFNATEWAAFLAGAREGQFDLG